MPLDIPWVPDTAWRSRTDPTRPETEALADPVWRMANLYDIRTDAGVRMPFVPTREQRVIIWDVHVRGFRNLIIPKARRLGMSTVLGILSADMVAFEAGVECALVDKTRESAEDKLARIVRFAVDSLPPALRGGLECPQGLDNRSTLGLRTRGKGEDIVSSFSAGVSFRGAGPQFLWISEWGTIQFESPGRSEEIKTGAMEAARRGVRVIETTWKGGKGGHVWDYIELALEAPEQDKTPEDWRLRFFPWWVDKRNVREGRAARIDAETHRYLDEKQAELGITFSPGQRLWYYQAKRENGIFVKRENPTTLDECWSAPVEGAIYADLIERLRVERRILPIDKDTGVEVDTFWDLGSPENTCVWYVQRLGGGQHDVVDCDYGLNLTTDERVQHMRAKGYAYGGHYIPHDGAADQRGGLTFQEELMKASLENVRVVPRTSDVEIGINAVRRLLSACRFNTRTCTRGIEALAAYHAKVEAGQPHRGERIVHDWASHPADALRTLAEAEAAGMLSGQGGRRFDVAGMKALDAKAALADVRHGNIIVQDHGAGFIEGPAAESWLAMAGRPQIGRLHVMGYAALRGRHVWAVLQVETDADTMETTGFRLLAASTGDGLMDPDLAAERVWATGVYYGDCLVVPIADDPEGTWQALSEAGVTRVLKRPRSVITRSTPQIGWHSSEDLAQPLAALAREVREEQLDCFSALVRAQLSAFMRQPGGKTGAMAGYGEEWVRALAVAIQCAPMATPFSPAGKRRTPEMLGLGVGAGRGAGVGGDLYETGGRKNSL